MYAIAFAVTFSPLIFEWSIVILVSAMAEFFINARLNASVAFRVNPATTSSAIFAYKVLFENALKSTSLSALSVESLIFILDSVCVP